MKCPGVRARQGARSRQQKQSREPTGELQYGEVGAHRDGGGAGVALAGAARVGQLEARRLRTRARQLSSASAALAAPTRRHCVASHYAGGKRSRPSGRVGAALKALAADTCRAPRGPRRSLSNARGAGGRRNLQKPHLSSVENERLLVALEGLARAAGHVGGDGKSRSDGARRARRHAHSGPHTRVHHLGRSLERHCGARPDGRAAAGRGRPEMLGVRGGWLRAARDREASVRGRATMRARRTVASFLQRSVAADSHATAPQVLLRRWTRTSGHKNLRPCAESPHVPRRNAPAGRSQPRSCGAPIRLCARVSLLLIVGRLQQVVASVCAGWGEVPSLWLTGEEGSPSAHVPSSRTQRIRTRSDPRGLDACRATAAALSAAAARPPHHGRSHE